MTANYLLQVTRIGTGKEFGQVKSTVALVSDALLWALSDTAAVSAVTRLCTIACRYTVVT